jgi:hypothetical protein
MAAFASAKAASSFGSGGPPEGFSPVGEAGAALPRQASLRSVTRFPSKKEGIESDGEDDAAGTFAGSMADADPPPTRMLTTSTEALPKMLLLTPITPDSQAHHP